MLVALFVALPFAVVATPMQAAAQERDEDTLRVLLFYKPQFHASHEQAREAIRDLSAELGETYDREVHVTDTDDASVFTAENLATYDTLVFAQTGGVLFNDDQREALKGYIQGGGGWLGIHYTGWSAGGESEHDVNDWYLRLVGAVSEGHPENPAVRPATVNVSEPGHPLTHGIPDSFVRSDEWYDWNVNPAAHVRTLLEVDETTYGGGRQGSMHPVTWCQDFDGGRSWYTSMGHEGDHFYEPVMRDQLRNGLAYTSGLLPADCTPPSSEDVGQWSPVTPWPLMAINAALTHEGVVQSFGSTGTGCTDPDPYGWTGNDCVAQGGQFETDIWDPSTERTEENLFEGIVVNGTYTDLFCSIQVHDPNRRAMLTMGGDDSLGVVNDPVNGAIGVTSYTSTSGLMNEAPMKEPRWYPTATVMPNGDIVVQGGSARGVAGPGSLTPERYSPDDGTGWTLLRGAESEAAYGDGGPGLGPDENRWWYPRAWVAPENGNLFNISGTQMFELDPAGEGELTLRGRLPEEVADQGALGRPVGATSTAVMFRPGKILQVGGGHWANGGGPDGARAGFTVDLLGDGGTADPILAPTEPMNHGRHWANATMLPTGDVLVTGGGVSNNGRGGVSTLPEIWNPETGEWTTELAPHAHARLYHSVALLLPDGRVMIGGGGSPGPWDYTDVEFYSPSYLFDGNELAQRPEITEFPDKIGYAGNFQIDVSEDIEKVTLVRSGSVTHSFNNGQTYEELSFAQEPGSGQLTIEAPADGTYAPPGSYMLFAINADGTPSEAAMLEIDPEEPMDSRTPLVDQFEYPRVPVEWRSSNPPTTIDVQPGDGRMAPWTVESPVELVRGTAPGMGGLGVVGYHLNLGESGALERVIDNLVPDKEYRISLRYAQHSGVDVGPDDTVSADLSIGSLDTTITATADEPSAVTGTPNNSTFASYVGTFTAGERTETLRLAASGTSAGVVIDDLVIISEDPGAEHTAIHYTFDEGEGTTAANTGFDDLTGAATLTGGAGWSSDGVFGSALELPGDGAAELPDGFLGDAEDFTVALWAKAESLNDWTPLIQIGDGTDSYFTLQSQTRADGPTGLAATYKAQPPGSDRTVEERLTLGEGADLTPDEWTHVAYTQSGSTGTLYLNGEEAGTRDDFSVGMPQVGGGAVTTDNLLGDNSWPDPAFNGLLDDVRAYTTALTAQDISVLHAEGAEIPTEVSVSVDPSPSPSGEPVTVTATVEAAGDAVRGLAELWVAPIREGDPLDYNSRQGDPVVLGPDGSVTFEPLTLARGEHTIEVRYLGEPGNSGRLGWRSSSESVTHTVERPPPGEGVPAHYTFDEGEGNSAANSGSDPAIGAATLEGSTSFTDEGRFGGAVVLPGGGSSSGNFVRLPNDITADMDEEITVSMWVKPEALPNWVPLFQIGNGTDTYLLIQSRTQAGGSTGFAATLKAPGNSAEERLTLGGANDLPLGEWTHVVFTLGGSTGKIYFDGELMGTRTDFSIGIGDIGQNGRTGDNYLGNNNYPDAMFDGVMDDLRIYEHELSEEEVRDLFDGDVEGEAPVTTATTDPAEPDGQQGWYVTAPTVTLTAEADGPGEITTEYRIGDGDWTEYTEPFTVEDGTHTVAYRSSGPGGTEEDQTLELQVDTAAPELSLQGVEDGARYGIDQVLEISAEADDATSGVDSVELLLDGETVEDPFTMDLARRAAGDYELSAVATDTAGNTAEVTAVITVEMTVQGLRDRLATLRKDGEVNFVGEIRLNTTLIRAEVLLGIGLTNRGVQALEDFRDLAGQSRWVPSANARELLQADVDWLIEEVRRGR